MYFKKQQSVIVDLVGQPYKEFANKISNIAINTGCGTPRHHDNKNRRGNHYKYQTNFFEFAMIAENI